MMLLLGTTGCGGSAGENRQHAGDSDGGSAIGLSRKRKEANEIFLLAGRWKPARCYVVIECYEACDSFEID